MPQKVEPLQYQRTTNIDEHNQIVQKENEIIDVINGWGEVPADVEGRLTAVEQKNADQDAGIKGNADAIAVNTDAIKSAKSELGRRIDNVQTDIDALDPRVLSLEDTTAVHTTQITNLEADSAEALADITAIKQKDQDQDADIGVIEGKITEIKSDIAVLNAGQDDQDGRLAGLDADTLALSNESVDALRLNFSGGKDFNAQIVRGSGEVQDTNIVTMPFIETATLVPSATERAFKLAFRYADGTTYDTNEFVIPEGGGTEVVVTGVTLEAGTQPNSFKVSIKLSDTSTIDSNDFLMIDAYTKLEANGKFGEKAVLDKAVKGIAKTADDVKAILTCTRSDGTSFTVNIDAVTDLKAGVLSADRFSHTVFTDRDANITHRLTFDVNPYVQDVKQSELESQRVAPVKQIHQAFVDADKKVNGIDARVKVLEAKPPGKATIVQDASGITVDDVALQDANATRDGLMTKELVKSIGDKATQASMTAVEGRVTALEGKTTTVSNAIGGTSEAPTLTTTVNGVMSAPVNLPAGGSGPTIINISRNYDEFIKAFNQLPVGCSLAGSFYISSKDTGLKFTGIKTREGKTQGIGYMVKSNKITGMFEYFECSQSSFGFYYSAMQSSSSTPYFSFGPSDVANLSWFLSSL